MAVSSVGRAATNDWEYSTEKPAEDRTSLSMDDFFTLIAAQLTNQDMNTATDNSEMLNQMVQMASIEAMNALTTQSTQSYAGGLLGQKIQVWNVVDGELTTKTGTVTGVNLLGEAPILYLDGEPQGYDMSQVASIGEIPKDEAPENPEDPESPGGGDEPAGGEGPVEGSGTEGENTARTRSAGTYGMAENDKVTGRTAANEKIATQTAGEGPAVARAAQAAVSERGDGGPAA